LAASTVDEVFSDSDLSSLSLFLSHPCHVRHNTREKKKEQMNAMLIKLSYLYEDNIFYILYLSERERESECGMTVATRNLILDF
jgi:hypothetical protein